jgi:hypothetical protein
MPQTYSGAATGAFFANYRSRWDRWRLVDARLIDISRRGSFDFVHVLRITIPLTRRAATVCLLALASRAVISPAACALVSPVSPAFNLLIPVSFTAMIAPAPALTAPATISLAVLVAITRTTLSRALAEVLARRLALWLLLEFGRAGRCGFFRNGFRCCTG